MPVRRLQSAHSPLKITQGSNSTTLRRLNERAVLNAVRAGVGVSKADIARTLGLTPPAVSAIVETLVNAGYLEVRSMRTGSVGQPSKLYGLRARGAFSVGLHIGRREMNCILVDFLGNAVGSLDFQYAYPKFDFVSRTALRSVRRLIDMLPKSEQPQVVGIGISMPHIFDFWGSELNYPPEVNEDWKNKDLRRHLAATFGLPVLVENDASSAALAELDHGVNRNIRNFFYVYINTYIGGGLVLDSRLVRGPQGLAASFGQHPVTHSRLSSVPVPARDFEYLFRRASVFVLLRHLSENGIRVERPTELEERNAKRDALVAEWRADTVNALVQAIIGTVSIIDVEAIVIDGVLPRRIVEDLVVDLRESVNLHEHEVVILPKIVLGQIGHGATALGASLLPMHERFWLSEEPLGVE